MLGLQASTTDAIVFSFISQIINHDTGPLNTFINSEYIICEIELLIYLNIFLRRMFKSVALS
jgi:hypothetical protein